MIKIEKAVPADRDAIMAIAQEAYSIYVPRMDKKPFPMIADYAAHIDNGEIYVLRHDGALSGFIVLLPQDAGVLLIDNVAVTPASQGLGLGRRLIGFAGEFGRQHGFAALSLYTNECMLENLRFYPRLGFAETHRAVQNGYRRVFFRKNL